MRGQIVQHEDITRAQRRHEDLLDIGLKNLAIYGALMHEGCGHTRAAQTGGEVYGFQWPCRTPIRQRSPRKALPRRRAIFTKMAGFVDKDQAVQIESG